jgi:hypothetical protein
MWWNGVTWSRNLDADEWGAILIVAQSNYRINATVRPVTPLAKGASVAPVRPARYASR